jgi:hypothetical protein
MSIAVLGPLLEANQALEETPDREPSNRRRSTTYRVGGADDDHKVVRSGWNAEGPRARDHEFVLGSGFAFGAGRLPGAG